MPLSRTYRRSLKLSRRYSINGRRVIDSGSAPAVEPASEFGRPGPESRRSDPARRPAPHPLAVRGANALMTVVMVGVTLWSCSDGGQSAGVAAAATVATVAAVKVLDLITAMMPPTRLTAALSSGLWVLLFMPGWDWLSGQYEWPLSWGLALGLAVVLSVIRYLMMRNGPFRRP